MKDKPQETELLPPQNQALTRHDPQPINMDNPVAVVAGMMQTVLDRGVTQENVGAMEKLVDLFERMQTKAAEQKFNEAFVALQKEMPNVQAKKPVPNNDGTVRYRFAPYEDIMEQVHPMLVKHGFTVSFSTKFAEGRIITVCMLRHTAGHSASNEFAVRVGKGPPGSSEAQADGAAGTYSKRHALCNCLNIVVEADEDARAIGATITKDQADSLRQRVLATGSDEKAFLRYAQSESYETIGESMYAMLDASLRKKEKK